MKTLIALSILAALIGGVVVYQLFFYSGSQQVTDVEGALQVNETVPADENNTEFSGVGTLAALQARGGNFECSLTYKPNEYEDEITGTYFYADGKVRGDFLVPSPDLGDEVLSSMIVNEDMLYVWSEINGEQYGMKITIPEDGEESQDATPVPDDVSVRYTCKPWTTVDNSVFVPPSTVLFQDASDLMQTGMEYGTIYEEGESAPY